MLPENRLSSVPFVADYLPPDDQGVGPLFDWERGGFALNDPSQGLMLRDWKCFVDGADVKVQADSDTPTVIFNQAGIVSLSFCFDQSMRPCVAYETSSGVFLRWYASAVVNYVTTSWGATFRSPRVTLDDKRLTQFATRSDIIFAYIRGEFLCYRQQRDRFTTERVLQGGVGPNTKLNNVGMNRVLRLQFDLA